MNNDRIKLSQIAPELRSIARILPNPPIGSAFGRWMIRSLLKLLPEKQYAGVQIEKQITDEGIAIRVYKPERALSGAALLWIHGGGMVIGSALQDESHCVNTALNLGILIVSVDYRLAPENPFPVALDDCYSAWNWLQKHTSDLHIDNLRIAVGGQSAGGGLAASLAQRIHDSEGIKPAAQWLFCPMLDDRTAIRYELDEVKHKLWNNNSNRIGWSAFLGTKPGVDNVPDYAVPARREDLSGLPPTWIGVGDIELFFDEAKTYANNLKLAGVDCTLDIVPGVFHVFESIASNCTLAQGYISRSHKWLYEKLGSR